MFEIWGVRYQLKDVERSIKFYTQHLGFKLEHRQGRCLPPSQLMDLRFSSAAPGSSGSRPLPDRRQQEPGGWNRIVLRVDDLRSVVETMKNVGLTFRNEIETGPAGKQIQVEDPDGNSIELFEPASQR